MRPEVCENWISLSGHTLRHYIVPVTELLELKDIARYFLNLCIRGICHLAISVYSGKAGAKKAEYSQKARILRRLLRNHLVCNCIK